jgi:hypothetical protein
LQAKSELAVKSRVDELREMLVKLQSIKKQLDQEFALRNNVKIEKVKTKKRLVCYLISE